MTKTYDYISFLDTINSLGQEAIFQNVLEYAMKLPKNFDKTKVKKFFETSYINGTLGMTKDRLDMCVSCIDQQLAILEGQEDITDKLLTFKNNIHDCFTILNDLVKEKTSKQDQEDLSGKATSLKSYDEKAEEIQKRLEKLESKLEKYEGALNDRLFSLIINTVAILGIFVAVAFAGFGANTLFSQIVFDTAEDTITNTFYLSLTALFVYNLLFLLFYCIFKIIERLSPDKKIGLWEHCWAFLIIDILGLILTVILFFIKIFG